MTLCLWWCGGGATSCLEGISPHGAAPVQSGHTCSYSHLPYDEDLQANVGLARLFQGGVVRVVVKGLGVFERRELQDADGGGRLRLPFQGRQGPRGVAPDQHLATVFCRQGGRLREICL